MIFKYTPEHEWVEMHTLEAAKVGITVHAQDALGDVVFIELPLVGREYSKGSVAGVVESVKAAADLYMPVTGTVVAVNSAIIQDPSLVNSDPMGAGWFFQVKPSQVTELDSLLTQTSYQALLQSQ